MVSKKTELENFLIYGIDEKERRVYFGSDLIRTEDVDNIGGVNQCSVQYAIRAIQRMVDDSPKMPIEIHMDSYGGDPYSLLGLHDLMLATSTQFKFYGRGSIMSAATWVMAVADERYLYPNTTIMVHNGWDDPGCASVTDQEIYREESNRLRSKLHEIYADNSRMPITFWEEVCKRDLYLTAEEAVFLGLADRIIQPKKRGNLRKTRQHHLSQKIDKRRMNKLVGKLFNRIKIPTKFEVIIPEYKPEGIDEKLVIEEIKEEET